MSDITEKLDFRCIWWGGQGRCIGLTAGGLLMQKERRGSPWLVVRGGCDEQDAEQYVRSQAGAWLKEGEPLLRPARARLKQKG